MEEREIGLRTKHDNEELPRQDGPGTANKYGKMTVELDTWSRSCRRALIVQLMHSTAQVGHVIENIRESLGITHNRC
jgi:hypothetical protein